MGKQLIVNENLIAYSQAGEGERAVIFLHGWRSQKEVWQNVLSQLSIVNCQLFAIDLPGFGGSPAPRSAWTVNDYAEVVKGFIEKIELKKVIIVGHSFGGRVGIKLAAMLSKSVSTSLPSEALGHLFSPGEKGNIYKLVLVDSAGFALDDSKKNIYGLMAKIAKPFFKPKFMQGLRRKIYEHIGSEDYLATPELQKTFVNIIGEDLTEDMEKINCPTLIITGENDKDTPPSFGQKMQSLIPNSKLTILPGAGHFSFLDKPGEFAEELNKFIV